MGESRIELLAWVNKLLQLSYNKIEQLGDGAAYCQIFDSLWGNLPLHKVKFDAKHEYEYVHNYKVLQLAFEKHQIEKEIPVQKLIKCKFQDNIEFCQWVKRFHDNYYPGGNYDALNRRKVAHTRLSKPSSQRTRLSRTTSANSVQSMSQSESTNPSVSNSPNLSARTPGPSSNNPRMEKLSRKLEEQTANIEALEKERDFYYSKLRDIEIFVSHEVTRGNRTDAIQVIQKILYATDDEGFFHIPEDAPPEPFQPTEMYKIAPQEPPIPTRLDDNDLETF